jgi:hypothetical protein
MKTNVTDWLSVIVTLWLKRFAALFDGSAWLLIGPAFLWMYFRDPPLTKSIMEWTLLFFVLAGLAVILSRIAFPQLNLSKFLDAAMGSKAAPGKKAQPPSVAAAIVVASVVIFVAWVIQTMAMWARPIGTTASGG